MPAPRVCVLRAPGTNCDPETAFAFENCGGRSERVHLFRLLEQPSLLDEFQILCIPGGFSYGDDIGAGVIFGSELRTRLGDAVQRFLRADKLTLGICNGFQTLLKAGVLPGGAAGWSTGGREQATATLTWNDNGKYTALGPPAGGRFEQRFPARDERNRRPDRARGRPAGRVRLRIDRPVA